MNPLRTTEMQTLTMCEMKWYLRYGLDRPDQGSPAMTKGTLWHAFWDEWWVTPGGLAKLNWNAVMDRLPEDRAELVTDEIADDVLWMAQRYDEWRGGGVGTTDWEVVEQEVELEGTIWGTPFQGRADDIRRYLPTGDLYVGECKTMRDWRRLDYLMVDPQLSNYVALARQCGYPVVGVFYDAAKTYRWKTGKPRPVDESFRELLEVRSDSQIRAAGREVAAVEERRVALWDRMATPVRNIGANTCSFCAYKDECWGDLAALNGVEVEWQE